MRAWKWLLALGLTAAAGGGACATGLEEPPVAAASGSGAGGTCPEDCSALADTPYCDPQSQTCVGCLPDTCDPGSYCSDDQLCEPGCDDDDGCQSPLVCDLSSHQCVECLDDDGCARGEVCAGGTCKTGCTSSAQCVGNETCCDGACTDLQSDLGSCGACGVPCPELDNASVACSGGQCLLDSCTEGFDDCNANTNDGCEWDLANGPCSCEVGTTTPCYTGAAGTLGNGECAEGIAHCLPDGSGYGECGGQTTPGFDWCDDDLDNDCTGSPDDPPDEDSDGWSLCQGDCCDSVVECGSPELVNVGAIDVAGNELDDDCDGETDEVATLCDTGLTSDAASATDYARALDLCENTSESPSDPADLTWGLIDAEFSLADGSGTAAADAKSIRSGFGTNVSPLLGSSLAVLATGVAAAQNAPNDQNPDYVRFQFGTDFNKTSPHPADWLMLNGGQIPNANCPEPQGDAMDPVMLKLRVRVPTNARSFSFNLFFYSSEYPEWLCSAYNDFFVALLDSTFVAGAGETDNPADKNIAVYDAGGGNLYPIGVNLAHGNTGLFNQCENGTTGCTPGATNGSTNQCTGIDQLVGTGFDDPNPPSLPMGGKCCCGSNDLLGGGTGWLKASGNVVPGEIMELRLIIWDSTDQIYDSLVLLDKFEWSLDASTPGVSE